MTKRMSRGVALLLCMLISVVYMPVTAFADDTVTITVTAAVQKMSEFLANDTYTVNSGIAEEYGYEDAVPQTQVSALDVLVAIHVAKYGDDKAAISEALTMVSGSPTKMLGQGSSSEWTGFAINQSYPMDNTGSGYLVNSAPVNDGDDVDFFWYEDDSWCDYITKFDGDKNITVYTNEKVNLKLSGYIYMNGYSSTTKYEPVESALICAINEGIPDPIDVDGYPSSSEATDYVTTDENGEATITFTEAGNYQVTACGAELGADFEYRIIMPRLNITVKDVDPAADANVKMSVSDSGTFAKANDGTPMINKTVTVTDINKDGKLTLDEALVAAHKKYNAEDGYAAENGSYGLEVKKLWGIDTTALGFYRNNNSTNAVNVETVNNGDEITAFIYGDKTGYSDKYSYFNQKTVKAVVGKSVTLGVTVNGYDANYNVVKSGLAGATIAKIDTKTGKITKLSNKTDANGKAKVTFTKAGTYTITAVAKDGENIVPSVCTVTVAKGSQAMKVSTARKTVSYKKVKRASRYTSAVSVKNVKDKAAKTYTKVSGSKKLTINKKTGKIKVKKGTKKGTYKIRVKVKLAKTANYNASSKTVTIKVRVK